MRRPLRRYGRQLHLFQKEPAPPSWQSLSTDVRRMVAGMLGRLLNNLRTMLRQGHTGKGASVE
jgi:hypothetical protein